MQIFRSISLTHYFCYGGLLVFIAGLHLGFQPSEIRHKSALVLQLETMLSQCKDLKECQAINNVLIRAIKGDR